jgi:hypothetical protein
MGRGGARMSENKDLTRPLIDALNGTGGLAMRMNSGKVRVKGGFMQLHEKGTADILFFPRTKGFGGCEIPVWIETKSGHSNKEQIENQAAFREKVEALGHRYIRATTIDEGLAALR